MKVLFQTRRAGTRAPRPQKGPHSHNQKSSSGPLVLESENNFYLYPKTLPVSHVGCEDSTNTCFRNLAVTELNFTQWLQWASNSSLTGNSHPILSHLLKLLDIRMQKESRDRLSLVRSLHFSLTPGFRLSWVLQQTHNTHLFFIYLLNIFY